MATDNHTNETGSELDALFAEARSEMPRPDLAARALADAAAVQAAPVAAPVAAPRGRGWLAELVTGLGGWSAVSGITAAGVMGLAVGLYSPDTITGWIGESALPFTATGYAVTPDIGELWTESGDV